MKAGSVRILGILALVAVGLMGMWAVGYGQPYEPEHLWDRSGYQTGENWFGRAMAGLGKELTMGWNLMIGWSGWMCQHDLPVRCIVIWAANSGMSSIMKIRGKAGISH